MKIRLGYELIYDCPQPTPMILTLSVHYTRVSDMIVPDHLIADPPVPLTKALTVHAHRFSGKAQERIATLGGKAELIQG